MIRFDRFTQKAQEALHSAQGHATEHRHSQLQPEHLLWALIEQKDGVVLPVLQKLGTDVSKLAQGMADAIAKLGRLAAPADVQLSPQLGKILQAAEAEAAQFKDEYVSTEHILLAMTGAKDEAVSRLLEDHGVTHDAILKVLVSIRGSQKITDPNPEEKYQALERYSHDLTELARAGKLDPVIGRDEEIRRVVQVLSRRTKTIPSSSANPESVRLPSPKVWRSASLAATFPNP